MAEEPSEAGYPDMPFNVVATGLVDYVLPIAEMTSALITYLKRISSHGSSPSPDEATEEILASLPRILILLRNRTGHDFTEYKHSTVIRRIARRMQVLGIYTAHEYCAYLREHGEELDLLFRNLLIGVTRFFRDPEAFAALAAKVIAELIDPAHPRRDIRVWVPGCSTGEEAYSIAILIAERAVATDIDIPVQIFASDIDEATLASARKGYFPAGIAEDVGARSHPRRALFQP